MECRTLQLDVRAMSEKVHSQQQHCHALGASLEDAGTAAAAAQEATAAISAALAAAAAVPASIHAQVVALTESVTQLRATDGQVQQQLSVCASERYWTTAILEYTSCHP